MSTLKTYRLERELEEGQGIWGVMTDGDGLSKWYTLENAEKKIPDGTYERVRDYYYRGDYETFEVQVEGRDRILVHAANYPHQLEGCIAPGTGRGRKDNELAVWSSRKAHDQYMESLVGQALHLLVITTKQDDETDE